MNFSEKLIFKSGQIYESISQFKLALPKVQGATELEYQDKDDFDTEGGSLPSEREEVRAQVIESINAELEEYRQKKLDMIEEELKEVQQKVETAKEGSKAAAFEVLQEAKAQAKREVESGRSDGEQLVQKAKLEVERMVKEAEMRTNEVEHEAYQKGYDAGREVGYKTGESEVHRLIDRLGTIIGRALEVRGQLIADSEKQMVDMVLMIVRKVIKDETSERREIVLANIREALKRIKDRDRIDIRVNFADLDLTTAHKDELIKMMETLRKVNIYEDSRVDRGGCIIETNIGSIDARISTQLKQIEEAIRNAEPF